MNKRRDLTLRGKILFTPGDDLRITLAGAFGRVLDDRGLSRTPTPNSFLPGNKLIDGLGRLPGEGYYDSRSNVPYNTAAAHAKSHGVSLKINYDAGWAQLQSTTAYNKYRTSEVLDQDGSNLGPPLNLATRPGRSAADAANSPLDAYLVDDTKAIQQEILLTGTYGKLDLTSGAFIYYARSGFAPIELRSNALSGGPVYVDRASFNTQYTHSYAGFAQGTFHITPKTGLTVGLRYTIDDRRINGFALYYVSGGALPPPGSRVSNIPATKRDPVTLAVTPFTGSDSNRQFNKLTYRFALDHHFTDDILAYVSYSRGFKSGVFNTTTIAPAVNPEVLDSAAAGIKTDLFDHHVRFNVEGFHYNYKNLQVSQVIAGTTALLNAAKAEIYGVDVEAAWSIPIQTSDLRLSTNFSFLHAKYKSFPGAPAFYPVGTTQPTNFTGCAGTTRTVGEVTCTVDASGNNIIFTPKRSGTVAADYTYPLGNSNRIVANATYYFNSGYAGSYDATLRQSSYHILSASAGATIFDGKLDLRVWGSNLTKAIYYLQLSHAAYGLQGSVGAPRTYGVTVGYHFGG